MARAIEWTGSTTYRQAEVVAVPRSPLYQAYQVLHWGLVALPVIAGLDKFAHLLTNWNQYVAPNVASFILNSTPFTVTQFMMGVGAVEVIAGLLVAIRPRIGGFVVAAWLAAIIGNLAMGMQFFDVALRDFGLMLGAVTLGLLARHFDRTQAKERDVLEDDDAPVVASPSRGGPMWRHREGADDTV